MRDLPRGTVTFLFTDVEGSTRLLKRLGDRYADVLAEHQQILRQAFEDAGGREIDTQGDSFFVAFARAKDAVGAAVAAQRALASHQWPDGAAVRVRMGLHTGEPVVGEDRYVGLGVHKAARVGAAAHGGQVLLSNATRELVEDELPAGVRLVDLGEHGLKDIDRPERVFQVKARGLRQRFPPLRVDAPPPRSRLPKAGLTTRRRPLAAAVAALALTGLIAGLALALTSGDGTGRSSTPAGSNGASGPTAPGKDPNTIVPGKSIGAVRLGMNKQSVRDLYGTGIEGQWRARGRTGDRVTYSGDEGALTVSFYDGKVVQVGTSSKYYTMNDGVRVGLMSPDLYAPEGLGEALRKHEVVEINPGVYTWKNFDVELGSESFCLRDDKAATQLVQQGGPSDRIVSIWITDARFLAYLLAHNVGPSGLPSAEIFCAAEPLQP